MMLSREAFILTGFLLAAFALVNVQGQSPEYNWQKPEQGTWEELQEGEILVEKIRDTDGTPGIRALFTISATRDELWGMLTDYENFAKIYGGIDSLQVLDEDKYSARVEIFQDIRIKNIEFVLLRRYENPGHRLTWDRVAGDLKMVKGSWDIFDSPEDGVKLVAYTSYFKYGGIIPTRLSRNWAIEEVRIMAANARDWIRNNRTLYSK